MVELCLMASHGYPPGPGLVLLPHQSTSGLSKDCLPLLPSPGPRKDIIRLGSLNLPDQRVDSWKPKSELADGNNLFGIDSTTREPVLIDVEDSNPDSILFSFGIAEQCSRHEKILKFLMSGSNEREGGGLDLSMLSDLMGIQALTLDKPQTSISNLGGKSYSENPLLDLDGHFAHSSAILVHPDGRVTVNGAGAETKDLLSTISEFYMSKNSAIGRTQALLVPYFDRRTSRGAAAISVGSSSTVQVAPSKSPEKIKLRPSPRKNNKKIGKERDLYRKNYFHACESLLSIMVDKKRHKKTAIQLLKKSVPELPELLTHFSASIAGTGIAVLFSVISRVACCRVPFCASKFLNTAVGLGLVWLSWAVNHLRDTVTGISKSSGKLGLKENEMMRTLDRSVKDIYIRAAALMVVALLRFA